MSEAKARPGASTPPQSDAWLETTTSSDERAFSPASLTSRTASGFSWLFAQTITLKGVTLVGQVALAWLLAPTDFGVYATALTITSFVGLLQNIGLRELLVQRQGTFDQWSSAATWMAATAGTFTFLVTATIAFLFVSDSTLRGLLLILGSSSPLVALQAVPMARLQVEYRFASIAGIGLVSGVATIGLTVMLAYIGFGAFSFAWPRLVVAAGHATILFAVARPQFSFVPQFDRWRPLLRDSALMLGTSACVTIIMQADYAVLALFHDDLVVGIYFFAFTLATQTVQLLAQNLASAFLPALSALQTDPVRQVNAFFRGCRAIAFVAIPICLLQAALAGPIIRALFDPRWIPAIPTFAVLSAGMAFVLMGSPAASLFQAQGRFAAYLRWAVFCATGFVIFAFAGVILGGALPVAVAVSLFFVIFGPLGARAATRAAGSTWSDVLRIYIPPVATSAVAVGIPAGAIAVFEGQLADLAVIGIVAAAAVPLYLVLGRFTMPEEFRELTAAISALWWRRSMAGT